ncbi:virulence factor MviN [Antribacter sp. KLBMP9083]|uniref:Virulence factor MviN n=1 Tax=Antribacter soli TaxID=2910976 RepID=A0AA41QG23_9MICO|nr:lipid II flippase MurJ [Antribacter soli]MCF4121527.1 virulence factor MviN [Antribacter soli]
MGAARRAQTLVGAALLVTVVTLASRVVGFGRWLAQGAFVGTGGVDTLFNAANLLPNVLFEVAAGGALAGAVVPLLSGPLSRVAFTAEGSERARQDASRIASALLGWTLVVLVPLAAVMALLARPIVEVFDLFDPLLEDVAAGFLRVFAVQVPLYGLAVVLGGVLQAHKRFFWPAFAPLVSSVVVIVVYAVFGELARGNQQDVAQLPAMALDWLAWGTTAGVAFLALPLVVPVWRTGVRLRPTLRFPGGEGRRAARLAFAGVGALVAQQLSVVLVMRAANGAGGSGAFTVYLYAQAVYLLPYAVLAFPIATSAFPRFAEHAHAGRLPELRDLVARTTRTLLLVVAVGVAALVAAAPLVQGVFDLLVRGDAPGLSATLTWMAPGLMGYALILHLSRALYAVDRGRAAVVATAAGWGVVALGAELVRTLAGPCAPEAVEGVARQAGEVCQAGVLSALGGAGTAGMTVAAAGLLLAVRRHLGAAAVAGVGRALLVLAIGATTGSLAGRWSGRALESVVPVSGAFRSTDGRLDRHFDAEVFGAYLGIGLAAGLVAAAVVLAATALLDRDLRARVGSGVGRLVGKARRRPGTGGGTPGPPSGDTPDGGL